MKKLLTMVFASVLGGAIALGSYKTFFEKNDTVYVSKTETKPQYFATSNSSTLDALEKTDFTEAAEKTVHSVVHVKNVTLSAGNPTMQDLFFGRMPQRKQLGTGSGVIISPDGYIITNNHVIDGSEQLSVTLNDNRTFSAEIIGTDPKNDIALLKIEADGELPYTRFADSDQAKIGEWVLAVGNPFNLTSTVTAGIISAKSRDLGQTGQQSFIQTDAAVNPGNSGGALVNSNGDLIGINTAISSQTGSYIGYSFAVPSNIAQKIVRDIMEFGDVQNGILGVSGAILNSENAEKFDTDTTQGFAIGNVDEDSGAELAGLQKGDIIKKIDNTTIKKFSDLRGYLTAKSPNDVVKITYLRNGEILETNVTLLKPNTYVLEGIGVLKNAKKDDLKRFKLKSGVKISDLNNKTERYFNKYGVNIKEGLIITKINDQEVRTIDDVKRVMTNKSDNERLRVELINDAGEKEHYIF